jgi:hypothetical protein
MAGTTIHLLLKPTLRYQFFNIRNPLAVVERIPTQRAAAATTRLEPLEQTPSMKQIPTSPTPLLRQLLITPHNPITNSTLNLTLERALYIPLKCRQRIDKATIKDRNRAEASA